MYKAGDEILFWKHGASLDRAIFHFSTPAWKEKYTALKQAKDAQLSEAAKNPPIIKENSSAIVTMMEALKHVAPFFIENPELKEHVQNMRNEIIRGVLDGALIALGYSLPRSPADPPHIIPDDVWSEKVDWDKSTITGRGLHFESVRLARRNMKVGMELEHEPQRSKTVPLIPPPTPRAGRPSIKSAILEAYDHLCSQKLIDFDKPMTHCYDPIRNYLAKTYPDRAGQYKNISKEAIRVVISSLFKKP